jgi:uncharacterized protein with ACT and thioredoxin-like domain
MKCRPLRRRYLLLRSNVEVDDRAIISEICNIVTVESPPKVIDRRGPFIILRIDNKTLASLKAVLGKHFIVRCGGTELRSVVATGTIRKAREKIKKTLIALGGGDEEAVPVNQKSKDVDKMTD